MSGQGEIRNAQDYQIAQRSLRELRRQLAQSMGAGEPKGVYQPIVDRISTIQRAVDEYEVSR